MRLYLAGGLFNAGQRLHLLYLEKYLKELDYEVILPQREALKFIQDSDGIGSFKLKEIAINCRDSVRNRENIFVGCIDGPDADSGTAVEYGIAIGVKGEAILYRTDFRTNIEQEIGVNGMFNIDNTNLVYLPCFFTELEQVEEYYKNLAESIHLAICKSVLYLFS